MESPQVLAFELPEKVFTVNMDAALLRLYYTWFKFQTEFQVLD